MKTGWDEETKYRYEERAAILEYDADMPRKLAEKTAKRMVEREGRCSHANR